MIYLDNAATSHPKPEEVYVRIDRFGREVGANPGRSGHRLAVEAEGEIDAVRREVASLFGCRDPRRVVFTLNATDALNMALKGVLDPGDHVVTTVMEHNSVSRPLARMERQGLIEVSRVEPAPGGRLEAGAIERAFTPKTRLVAVGQASNVTGTAAPLMEIGGIVRRRGALLAVDAAQGGGVLPLDMERDGIDLLAFTGHKGLLGPTGTGGLLVGERVEPRPWREGGTGGDSASVVQPAELPWRLEAGTPNTAGLAGLGEALRWVRRRGVETLGDGERVLARLFWERLRDDDRFALYGKPPDSARDRTGVVSFNVAGKSPEEVGAILDAAFGIAVRTGLHCAPGAHRFLGTFPEGAVRVSPGPFNSTADIEALVEALMEIASTA